MESCSKYYRFFVLSLSAASVLSSFHFTGFKAINGFRMTKGVRLEQGTTLNKCFLLCAKRAACTSVNYYTPTSVCEINNNKMKMPPGMNLYLIRTAGWIVYEKLPCGLGFINGEYCHHFQRRWGVRPNNYYQAKQFCRLLGSDLPVHPAPSALRSNADAANGVHELVWIEKNGGQCRFLRLLQFYPQNADCSGTGRAMACQRQIKN